MSYESNERIQAPQTHRQRRFRRCRGMGNVHQTDERTPGDSQGAGCHGGKRSKGGPERSREKGSIGSRSSRIGRRVQITTGISKERHVQEPSRPASRHYRYRRQMDRVAAETEQENGGNHVRTRKRQEHCRVSQGFQAESFPRTGAASRFVRGHVLSSHCVRRHQHSLQGIGRAARFRETGMDRGIGRAENADFLQVRGLRQQVRGQVRGQSGNVGILRVDQ
mmetsp:Transcript_13769/g.28900  ORF Transcript_13769/g.28900 Transcript_13769/m.28900 type:complete len:222 (-) Transcript_13769:388-1053(-)